MTLRWILALPMFVSLSAQGQDRPVIFPSRDVSVTYRATAEGQPTELTMSWNAAQRLMRMDMPGGQGYMIVNHQTGAGFMVMQPMRMIMDMPAGEGGAARFTQATENARFTRQGADRVANTPCTNWRIEDRGEAGRICLTADGVMLRAVSETGAASRGNLEATRVDYTGQDPARFVRPQGYQTMPIPSGGAPGRGGTQGGGAFPNRGSALPPPGVVPR